MSNYDEFMKEKSVIDELVKQNYIIKNIQGTLEGDVVEFEKLGKTATRKSIRLTNPESRKYVTTILIKGQSKN